MYCSNQQRESQAKAGPALRNKVHGSLKVDPTEGATIEKNLNFTQPGSVHVVFKTYCVVAPNTIVATSIGALQLKR